MECPTQNSQALTMISSMGGRKSVPSATLMHMGKQLHWKEEDIKMLGKEVTSEPLERKLGIPKQMYWIHSHYF